MVDYEQAIKKPFTDLKKLLIGIIISAIPIVHWIGKGFAIECSGLGKNKSSKKMPEWKGWGDLFFKGLASDIISLIYVLPAILVIITGMILVTGSFDFYGLMDPGRAMTIFFAGAPIILLGLLVGLVGAYMAPIGVLNYVKTKKFGKAFDFKIVKKKTLNFDYFIVWLIAMVVTGVLSFVLSLIPIVGGLIGAFVGLVISYSLFGEIFSKV